MRNDAIAIIITAFPWFTWNRKSQQLNSNIKIKDEIIKMTKAQKFIVNNSTKIKTKINQI